MWRKKCAVLCSPNNVLQCLLKENCIKEALIIRLKRILMIDTHKNVIKERVSKHTYSMLQHCLRLLYTMNGNSKH